MSSPPHALRWRPLAPLPLRQVSPSMRSRLGDQGSLTDEIIAACPRAFRVEVLRSGWGRPRPDEAEVLGLAGGRWALLREVRLMCGAEAWVYARSVIPLAALQGPWRRLRHLGGRSLGALLFDDPCVERLAMQWTRVGPGHDLYRTALPEGTAADRPASLYGRRSLFRCRHRRLLVSEFFLPGDFID